MARARRSRPTGVVTVLKRARRLPLCPLAAVFFAATASLPAQTVPPQPIAPPPVTSTTHSESGLSESKAPMTKDQAAELFRSVDEILAFVAKDSHLKASRPVKRKLLTRDQVQRDLRSKMSEDEGAKRLERSELVLKKFGLLDRDFALKPFLLSLLTEQVAAYYDPKTRTVNMLDWVKPDEQKSVLAHELTHAVQDDRVHLEKWGTPGPTDISKNVGDDNRHIQLDEASTARESVTEGQAMAVFVDYELKDLGKTLADSPEIGDRMREMASDTAGSPILARAPLLLQESLLFPYGAGLGFEQQLLQSGGVDVAFAGALDRPPGSSHEILHAQDYLAKTPVPVLTMPDIHGLLDKDWDPYDVGVMGELDVRIITELFGGQQMAGPLAVAWNGGIYFAAQNRNAAPAVKQTPASIGTIYYSQWKNRDSARSFLKIYAGALARKYSALKKVDLPNGDEDHLLYSTSEGDVWLSLEDTGVFISEGYDRAMAKQLEAKYREAQGRGPLMQAGSQMPQHELTMGFRSLLPGIGVPRAVIDATHRLVQ
ncbi:hypothetical protein Terro_3778 [Terriglobus roseus DSM 18391]|uniref:DUF4157 domain-containing protein n=1 Tax=Terriglobus roseus (strain DSM 18391 / NRRL B-41598 / KBS 63) TaxID=926566 RepID=I3ZL70_TERRK|nr:hypothetical protein Terro_3778 [Terriglobus roseus DSM 18391]